MWSGTFRKAWYIDNPFVMNEMIKEWSKFVGGMSSQFLDLKNIHSIINEEIKDSVSEVIDSGVYIGGAKVVEFENAYANIKLLWEKAEL